ncbi:UDP-N-acetylenolpyruvoylglucosamine reductase [Paenibacillus sp. 598K]|nr:UDP-N-acetylenolpyruvoylglucosamine reductase [Paenibacillus sp. 598K]
MQMKPSVVLAEHTFIQTGGVTDLYVQPATHEEAQAVARCCAEHAIPLTVLGFGTNVIIRDSGIRGVVMNLNLLDQITVNDDIIIAGSGASLIEVSRTARDYCLSGLEFACGIPGSVGGALMMNAGAYGGEISFVLARALVLTRAGDLLELYAPQFEFGYRSSVFERAGYIVLEAEFRLEAGELCDIQGKMDHFTFLREDKQPLEYPSCGSVFKRPPGLFAGKLIADSGLQGTRIGGAEVSTKHAGFMVNIDRATSTDYLALIDHVKQAVKARFGVELETEVKIIGDSEPSAP